MSYGYDGAWRPLSLYSSRTSSYLVGNATGTGVDYTALDQPLDRGLGNGWVQTWAYGSSMARLRGLQIGPTGTFSHTYAYDPVGNVGFITNTLTSEVQSFGYDHRDRLTTWTLNGTGTSYAYSPLGNLTAQGSTSYTYGAQGSYGGPHAVVSTNPGGSYSYDAAGNMLSGGRRTYTWTADNQPGSISSGGVTESYSYDGDNERLTRLRGGLTTAYLAGLQEEDVSGTGVVLTTRKLYPFDGQVVAELSGSTLYYLHGDHLGSVALVSGVGSPGSLVSAQDFDPWGAVRTSPAITQTTLNYTGQRLDGTGLLYYHARYYDPVLARWTSPDTLVPGMMSGKGGLPASVDYDTQMALMPLTVDFHEPQFTSALHSENAFTFQKGFWFQLSNQDQQQAKYHWGPPNPQALNRYSYVLNNPLRYTDPTGHYDYTFNWAVCDNNFLPTPETGYFGSSQYVSPADVMHELMSHPQAYFPFSITPTNGCSVMAAGCTYRLDPGVPFTSPYEVRVINVTSTSFSFVVTTPGGFASVGSVITFSTYEENGIVYLQQHGHTADPTNVVEYARQAFEVSGAHFVWQEMASRLSQHYFDY